MPSQESRKQAAIATLGSLGGGLAQFKPSRAMAISPKDISAKPNPQKQLGQRENNRFLAQTELLRGPLSANVNKSASSHDVTPFIPSSYIKNHSDYVPAYTEQPYTTPSGDVSTTKQADLSGLVSKLQSYVPKETAEASNKLIDASKKLYSTFASGFKPPEGQGSVFSNLGKQVADVASGAKDKINTGVDKLRELFKSKTNAANLAPTPSPTPTPAPLLPNSSQAAEAARNLSDSISNVTSRAKAQDSVRHLFPPIASPMPEMVGPPVSLAGKAPPATVSRASMLGASPKSPPRTFQTDAQAAIANKNLNETLNNVNTRANAQTNAANIEEQYKQFLEANNKKAPTQPSTPVASPAQPNQEVKPSPAPVIKYRVGVNDVEFTNAARARDLAARIENAGLGATADKANLVPNLKKYIEKYQVSDLNGIPPETRAAFEALPPNVKADITNTMVNYAKLNATLRGDPYYEPVVSENWDNKVLGYADLVNQASNIPLSLAATAPRVDLSTVPGVDPKSLGALQGQPKFKPYQAIQNVDNMRSAIETSKKVKALDEAMRTLYSKLKSNEAAGVNTDEDVNRFIHLLSLKNEAQAADAYGNDFKKPSFLPLFDPNKSKWNKTTETIGDAFTTLLPQSTLLRAGARGGLHDLGVPNADAWGDIAGFGAPYLINGAPSFAKLLRSAPGAAANILRNPKVTLDATTNAIKNINLWKSLKATPGKALDVVTSPGVMIAGGVNDVLKNPEPTYSSDPNKYSYPPAPSPSNNPSNASPPAAEAALVAGMTPLQKALIAAGISIPAAVALSRILGLNGSDELPEEDEETKS